MTTTEQSLRPDGIYTLAEACRYLRISQSTARRWIREGRLVGRKIGRDYRFVGADLLSMLAEAQTPAEQEVVPFGPGHPLLKLIGTGSSGRSDISSDPDQYLAEEAHGKR
jgi:excisionase family DNA binding protein